MPLLPDRSAGGAFTHEKDITMSDESGDNQYMVAARGGGDNDLSAFEQHLESIPGARILRRAGRKDQPRLIVDLPAGTDEQLRMQFNDTLIIERNAKLTPF